MLRETLRGANHDMKFNQIKCEVEDSNFSELQCCHGDEQCYYNDIYHEAFQYGYLIKPENEDLYSPENQL
jgi:hypothetical protein